MRMDKPRVFYNAAGDQIELFLSAEPYYGARRSSSVTLYLSEKTSRIIGMEINGISKLIEEGKIFLDKKATRHPSC